jgi:hypothetical protein
MTNVDYFDYPGGKYNADTLQAMANLGMRNAKTLLNFNNLSPLVRPFEIAQRSIGRGTSLSTVQGWVNTAVARQEILVLTLHDISAAPTSNGWYTSSFQSLVDYVISQGIPVLTMDDLYQLQSGPITIPVATGSPVGVGQGSEMLGAVDGGIERLGSSKGSFGAGKQAAHTACDAIGATEIWTVLRRQWGMIQ